MTRTPFRLAAFGVSLIALGALAGCGDDAGGGASGPPLVVGAEDIRFDADEYRVAAGDLTIELVQEGVLPHSLVIEDPDGKDLDFRLFVNTAEVEDVGTIALDDGTYVFFCDVPGHRASGMESVVVVSDG
ncbi:MAG: plastocyanin/azurin family copper-binding protein [Actinomycetota bacterium]